MILDLADSCRCEVGVNGRAAELGCAVGVKTDSTVCRWELLVFKLDMSCLRILIHTLPLQYKPSRPVATALFLVTVLLARRSRQLFD